MIVRTWKSLPRLVRFILRNIAIGISAGWAFLAALLWSDAGGLYSMISHSSLGPVAFMLLAGGFAVTFGPAAVASAVLLGYEFEDGNDADKAPPAPVTPLEPARARAAAKR